MSIIEIALIGIALAMDAFAVSICKGLAMSKMSYKKTIIIALFFGVFQALMPLLGYFLGNAFASSIAAIDHWIAFILLGLIGINMIKEALDDEIECVDDTLRIGDLIKVSILSAISIIGIITFILCVIGVKIGNVFGEKYKSKAEIIGGIILILIGFKILIEHLFF